MIRVIDLMRRIETLESEYLRLSAELATMRKAMEQSTPPASPRKHHAGVGTLHIKGEVIPRL